MPTFTLEIPESGKIVYFTAYTNTNQYWRFDSNVLETYDPANIPLYSIPALEDQRPGIYISTVPVNLPQADWNITAFENSGGTPSSSESISDNLLASGRYVGNGKVETIPDTPPPSISVLSYSQVPDADAYFISKSFSSIWFTATSDDRQRALNTASQIIDKFRYRGCATTDDHAFPRSCWPTVPTEILYAQYEIAIAIIKGYDPEREVRQIRVLSRGYSSVRTTYNPKINEIYTQYGVPSSIAWQYLTMFFDPLSSISLAKVS